MLPRKLQVNLLQNSTAANSTFNATVSGDSAGNATHEAVSQQPQLEALHVRLHVGVPYQDAATTASFQEQYNNILAELDRSSANGSNTAVWGPWRILISISSYKPANRQRAVGQLAQQLQAAASAANASGPVTFGVAASQADALAELRALGGRAVYVIAPQDGELPSADEYAGVEDATELRSFVDAGGVVSAPIWACMLPMGPDACTSEAK